MSHAIRILHDQKVPMRDGVRLSADVYLPVGARSIPTILFRTPYESTAENHIAWACSWAKDGYAAVVQDCRGRYESEGEFYPFRHDGADGYDTMDWIVRQGWSDGNIGMWGRSYGALVQWHTAPLGHPALRCLAPHVVPDDYFNEYHYPGGAFQLSLSYSTVVLWSASVSLTRKGSGMLMNNSRSLMHLPLMELDEIALGRRIGYWRDWLEHCTDDEYWQSVSTTRHHEQIKVPVFQQGGWFDPYVRSLFSNFERMRAVGQGDAAKVQRVMIGPWSHEEPPAVRMGDLAFPAAEQYSLRDEERRWFDHWLKGRDNGVERDAPVNIFMMGPDKWVSASGWPLPDTEAMVLFLASGGRANSFYGDGALRPEPKAGSASDKFSYDPDDPVPTLGGVHSIQSSTEYSDRPLLAGPVDQRPIERRDDVLVYTGDEVTTDMSLAGPVEVILYAASSARDTDFTAKLVDVYPDGRALLLTEGIIRARYRQSLRVPELLERGEVAEYHLVLYPSGWVVRKGHRLRLDVSSSNFPRFSRNLNTGGPVATDTRRVTATQTVLHGAAYPSHVTVTVLRG